MFWTLVLSHLLADYPLQTDRLVQAKRHTRGLILHIGVHLLTMFVLSGRASLIVWPQLLALGAIHFVIDGIKNITAHRWPRVVVVPYLLDQLVHFLSIALIAAWIEERHGIRHDQQWMLYAAAYLFVTHIWFISERLVAHDNRAVREEIQSQRWQRMVVRAVMLTVYLLLGRVLFNPALAFIFPLIAGLGRFPYGDRRYGRPMLLLDLLVPLVVALLLLWLT